MIAYIPLIFAIFGLVLYLAASTNPKLAEIGIRTYFAGILVFLFSVSNHMLSIFTK